MIKYLIDGKVVADKIDSMMNSVIDTKRDVANGLLMANQEICKACIEDRVEAIPVEWLHKHSCSNVVDLWRKDCQLQDAKEVVCSILEEHNFNSYDEFIRYAWKMKAAAKLLPPEKLHEIIIEKDMGEDGQVEV